MRQNDVVVRALRSPLVPANPEFGAAVHIDATFFNTGTGDLNDDVGGHIAQGFGTDFRRIEWGKTTRTTA